MMEDSTKYKGLREQLVAFLKQKGIRDESVLDAFLKVPRHYFIPKSFHSHAYSNVAIPIACKQTISHPYTVAWQTQLLEVSKNNKVLEIGTGSGFQAAILKQMGCYVYTIERHLSMYEHTKKLFDQLGFLIAGKHGDGYLGWAEFAPFDAILTTCSATEIPHALLKQLKIGGRLVIPIGKQEDEQVMTKIVRISETEFQKTTHGNFRFVPMLQREE